MRDGINYLYRGTNEKEISRLQKTGVANKFLSTTLNKRYATGSFALSWKNPAVMCMSVPNNVPYLSYSSVQDLSSDDGNHIIDGLSENEVLIAPFCKLDIPERGENTHVGGGKYAVEYNVKVSKENLKEISPDQEQEYIKYIKENSEDCYEKINSLLSQKDLMESYEIDQKILNITRAKDELMRYGSMPSEAKLRLYNSYNNELKQYEEKNKELSDKHHKASEDVDKFKKAMRSVCMSRCKQIEKAIDKDYELQKNQYYKSIEEENIRKQIEMKSNARSYTLNSLEDLKVKEKKNCNYLKDIIKHKEQISKLTDNLDIKYFEFFKNPSELIKSEYDKVTKLNDFSKIANISLEGNIQDVDDKKLEAMANGTYDVVQKSSSYEGLKEVFMKQQNNAVLQGIHNKILWHKSIMNYNDLSIELKKIENRSTLDRVKDFFKGESKSKNERANQIRIALPLIKKKWKELEEVPYLNAKLEPEVVCAELKQLRGKLGKDRYTQMFDFINNNFDIDKEKLENQRQAIDNENKLPVVQNGKKSLSEAEKMAYFLKANGYTVSDKRKENNTNEVYIDNVQKNVDRCVKRNKECSNEMSMCLNKVNDDKNQNIYMARSQDERTQNER